MTAQQVFFFDSRVSNWQSLIGQLPVGSKWFELTAQEDGVEQMLRALTGLEGLSSIQIISHGEPGLALVGSTALDAAAIAAGLSQWAQIGASLKEGGDILLYGCEVGAGLSGNAFLQALAVATGADVAANADLTGLGGDWSLEATSGGGIEAQALAPEPAVGTLATVSLLVGVTNTAVLKPSQWETLDATLSPSITGATNITYQWFADNTVITGATTKYLFLDQSLVQKSITVVITYSDSLGLNTQTVPSVPTAPVSNVNDDPLGSVTISIENSVEVKEGVTLVASNTLSDLDGPAVLGVGYQWKADGKAIEGATTERLLLSQAQVGKIITVEARYTDAFGKVESRESASTTAVADVDSETTGTVTITGTAVQGGTLTGAHNLADPDGMGTVKFQWLEDGAPITGAVGSTLLLTQAQVGKVITLQATFLDGLQNTVDRFSVATFPVSNVNDPPKGGVTITGTAKEGLTLVAENTLTDADGPLPVPTGPGLGVSYQWYADGKLIEGSTGATLKLTQNQVGQSITVEARYTDSFGKAESVLSTSTAGVENVSHSPGGSLTVQGESKQGRTLTAVSSLTDADGMGAVSYQWEANGDVIPGATGNSLLLTQQQVGKEITVTARYTDGEGTAETVTSSKTKAVDNLNDAPSGAVNLTGIPVQGGTLFVSNTLDDVDGIPPAGVAGALAYEWLEGGVVIKGATGDSLILGQAQVGKTISVRATYTDGGSTVERVFSNVTTAVQNLNDPTGGTVSITGDTVQGKVLTVSQDLTDVDGMGAVAYQWRANGADIPGATGTTLSLTQAQVGQALTVMASYTDGQGTLEKKESKATDPVQNVNDVPSGSVSISGTVAQGQTLTVSNTLADADGMGLVSYEWRVGGDKVAPTTATTLELRQEHVGKVVTVVATYTDALNTKEAVSSPQTVAVVNVNDPPVGTVTILKGGVALTSQPEQGQSLEAFHNLTDPDGPLGTVSYQWTADGANIANATQATLTLSQTLVGKKIAVKASYTDALGTTETRASAETLAVKDVNDPTIGAVIISGKAEENQILTVSNTLSDADGIPATGSGAIRYQWNTVTGGVTTKIDNQTASTLQLTDDLVGKQITVTASYVDDQGNPGSQTSGLTDKIANVNDAPTGSVTLSPQGGGSVQQGATLKANISALQDADGIPSGAGAVTYVWRAGGVLVPDASADTLTLTQQHVGKVITVTASYTDGNGTAENVTSAGTVPVLNANDPRDGELTVSGVLEQRQVLTVSAAGVKDGDGMGTVSFQWNTYNSTTKVHTPIPGATAGTLTLLQAQVDQVISVSGTYTDLQGTLETIPHVIVPGGSVKNVDDLPTGNLVINGTTTQGQTLTAVSTMADLDGIPATGADAIKYQWKANGVDIAGASGSTYVLTQAEVGKNITVAASYKDSYGSPGSMVSAPRGSVANINDLPTGFDKISGSPVPGGKLTVPDGLADIDGLGTVSYQWRVDGAAISTNGTGSTYTVLAGQVGKVITVTASYTDGFGKAETKTSEGVAVVSSLDTTPPAVVSFAPADGAVNVPVGADIVLTFNEAIQKGAGSIALKKADGTVVQTFDVATSPQLSFVDKSLTVNPSADLLLGNSYMVEVPQGAVKDLAGNLASAVASYDFTSSANQGLKGMAYHWKSHALLNGVQVGADSATAPSSSDLFDLRAAKFDTATGILSVEVWANPGPGVPVEAFQFTVTSTQQGGTTTFKSSLAGSWAVEENKVGGVTTIGAFLSSGSGLLGGQKLGSLEFGIPAGAAIQPINFNNISVGDAVAAPQTMGAVFRSTDTGGSFEFSSLTAGNYGLMASRDVLDSGGAITAADALAALRIAVGLNPNPDPDGAGPLQALKVSPYQIMAADVNGSGTVTSADALAILRMAVKLSTALPQEWFFVEEKRDFWDEVNQKFTLSRLDATWDRTITADPANGPVNLVGVLKGDVNGNWVAPAGSTDLDVLMPTYFDDLALLLGVPKDQWGGGP